MYDGLADNYNYGTGSRSGYYAKLQAGNGAWGYPVRSRFHSRRPGMFVGCFGVCGGETPPWMLGGATRCGKGLLRCEVRPTDSDQVPLLVSPVWPDGIFLNISSENFF